MRIQHNISAMNSYRNFSNNTSRLSKNLEKLSTGYKINRAGDDAAGLAISEKMRSQISGITGAEKNAKDGISLIQTAEGALTEVHDMLNRMTTLAEQSANGTYDNKVDRAQLQKEVDSLKSEIDRIADSTNYNGIKLLDGSMSVKSGASTVKTQFNTATATALNAAAGTTYSQEVTINGFTSANLAVGDTVTMSFTYMDKDNKAQDVTVSAKVDAATNDGVAAALEGELKKVFGNDYPVTAAGAKLTFTDQAGAVTEDTQIVGQSIKFKVNGTEVAAASGYASGGTQVASRTAGKSELFTIDMTGATVSNKNFLEIDGKRFQILTRGQSAEEGATGIFVDQSGSNALNADSVKQIVSQLQDNGVAARVNASTATTIDINKTNVIADKGQGGLTLQIGDTADSFNTLRVSVSDMHSASIGIGGVDISTQEGAATALDKIKAAVNFVSDQRGSLGALQNRLDHTINNLGVMKENIQSAESLIRDTDVAEEMMTYTKNNILNQSAQAMLAQANQLPQGVLQLLG
ncbi:MAG: flagellin [Ruminococcaceae bacterium]|nr:flagellin [Oscillospiraceae bacterium]